MNSSSIVFGLWEFWITKSPSSQVPVVVLKAHLLQAWTPEELAAAFDDVDQRSETRAFFPGGVVNHRTPTGRTLSDLNAVALMPE